MKACSKFALNYNNSRRGMSLLLLVLLVLFFVAFYAFQHIYNAQTRAKQAYKMFHVNSAMNLAEAAIQMAILNVNTEMNSAGANKDKNFWYSNLRKTVSGSGGISKELCNLTEVVNLADKFKGKIKTLTVSLESVDKFYDSAGNPESFRDIEKCGAIQFNCVAEIMGTGARLRARKDFKVVHTRHPILNNYVLFVKDAWGEYCSLNNIGYPSFTPQNYKSGPGSREGFNPGDHNLKINAKPVDTMDNGKILFGGPMDSDKKIVISLSDMDSDMMDEVWPGAGPTNVIRGGLNATGSPKMEDPELEKIYKSLAYNPDDPTLNTAALWNPIWADILSKSSFQFRKKNCGFTSKYQYKLSNSDPDNSVVAEKAPPTTIDFAAMMNESWLFGSPVMNYISAMRELGAAVSNPTTPQNNITLFAFNDKKALTDAKGLDLFGVKDARKFTVVEGNVWQRYTNLAVLGMEIKIPADSTASPPTAEKILNFRFAVPAILSTMDKEYENASAVPKDASAFMLYINSKYAAANVGKKALENIFIKGMGDRACNAVETSPTKINYNSEVVVRPYNMGHPDNRLLPLNMPHEDMKKVLIEPVKGYDELSPSIIAKTAVIYENEQEFFDKCASKATSGGNTVTLLNLHGNVMIKSDLHLIGPTIVYRGAGVVMVVPDTSANPPIPRSIYIGTNIKKDDGDPVAIMTLYPTWGTINIMSDNLVINASLMALHPFYNPAQNLVSFIAGPNQTGLSANSLKIIGNVCVDRLNLPAFPKFTEIIYDP
ncbi:MAG TPA: hypothetical protein PKK26_16075, partial [Candidatus Wallbacteria bacterium]|nr:hypothetical protein [Candidatus Wallbacteria bacterium]